MEGLLSMGPTPSSLKRGHREIRRWQEGLKPLYVGNEYNSDIRVKDVF